MAEHAEGAVQIKAELLSNGVLPTPGFLHAYGPPFLEKRRAYGNPDDAAYLGRRIPQELVLLPDRLVCAVNIRAQSRWRLDFIGERFVLRETEGERCWPVTFPLHPAFYDAAMPDGRPVKTVITLYGGGSLGIFVHGECSLVDLGAACQYCSIAPNRARDTEFPRVVTEAALRDALSIALRDRICPIKQVMINGGNFQNPDRGFSYFARLVAAAREVLAKAGREDVDLHLIVYPPNDLRLLNQLVGLEVGVAMNMEVFDPAIFRRVCPGKHLVSGQRHIVEALLRAAEVLSPGNVFSILVGGLENQKSMDEGMDFLAREGVIPVINVFHPDPGTPLEYSAAPNPDRILEMGRSLQAIYRRISPMKPFYLDCGRNSLDTEAFRQLFAA